MLLTGLTFNIIGKSIREVSSYVYEKGSEKHAERKVERAEAKEREKAEKKRLEEESLRIKAQEEEENETQGHEKYMDRSAVLRATLNSLAMMNVANVINAKKLEAKKQKELLEAQKLLRKKHEETLRRSMINDEDYTVSDDNDEGVEDIVD